MKGQISIYSMLIILPNIHFRQAGFRLRDREVMSPFYFILFFNRQDSGSSWNHKLYVFSIGFSCNPDERLMDTF